MVHGNTCIHGVLKLDLFNSGLVADCGPGPVSVFSGRGQHDWFVCSDGRGLHSEITAVTAPVKRTTIIV